MVTLSGPSPHTAEIQNPMKPISNVPPMNRDLPSINSPSSHRQSYQGYHAQQQRPQKKRDPVPVQVDTNQSISPEGTSSKATGDGDDGLSGKEIIQYIMVMVTESDVHTVDEQLLITMGPGVREASIPADEALSTPRSVLTLLPREQVKPCQSHYCRHHCEKLVVHIVSM
jgi:hypothetical protein